MKKQISQNEIILKYYLYRHIRLDTNEPFYIGIGTKKSTVFYNTYESEYRRAFSIDRNNLWNKIVSKTDYEVEILMESDDKNFIKKKEVEFIQLYGRKNLNTGPLCNLTDGGDGSRNVVVSKETRKKISNRLKGKPLHENTIKAAGWNRGKKYTQEERYKLYDNGKKGHVRPVIFFETGEEFYSIAEGCRQKNIDYKAERKKVSNKTRNASFYFKDDYFDKTKNSTEVISTQTNEVYPTLKKAWESEGQLSYSFEVKKLREGMSIFKKLHEDKG